jgi:RimJ/RimL family protein N-acetyltransferase
MMIRAAFERLAAKRIYELASATNIPSRRMIESCGLTLVPTLKAAAVVASGAEKFTR